MPVVRKVNKPSNLKINNQSPYSLSAKIKDAIDDPTEREREREQNQKLIISCPHSCSQCQWGNTPTPSIDRKFVWNIDLEQENLSLLAQLKQQKILYENLQDQTQQKLLELEGEINWYRQQNIIYQDNEEDLLNDVEFYKDQLYQKEQAYKEWEKKLQALLDNCCQTELKLEELLTRYKKGKVSWEQRANSLEEELTEQEELSDDLAIKIDQLKKELNKQSQANRKKKKQLKRTSSRLKVAKQDKQNLQTWKNHHTCSLICQKSCCANNDYDTIKQERDTYKQKITELETQLSEKEQEIKEKDRIIEELRNKPPIQPVNNPISSESKEPPQPEPNVVGDQKEELLKTIKQQKEAIQQLQTQLSQTNSPKTQIVVKEVPVENLTTINQLQAQLKDKKRTLTQLNYLLLISVGISALLVLNRYLFKKRTKKIFTP